ncbi:hypothetical protein COCCADRAFT_26617 [Bipolaris zeicola 26-R-13]|uniref:Uncharacterized protein n=1 Tax=Cochliobolus carbonum (strain 26-R-13) TaxID=930089 RepID=W6YBR4_COCC2|nr:uncharacterized protein COCCADRAFT_26617 [Bipolaris zeicola 26-R-13]EUC32954.1 hypothetical protein COCCADRAFT_26617 [Bipolaris zeicola 26-R-13]
MAANGPGLRPLLSLPRRLSLSPIKCITWRRPVCSGTAARLFVASPRHRPDVFAWPACSVDPATCREGSTTVVAASWCLLNTLAAETAIVCYSLYCTQTGRIHTRPSSMSTASSGQAATARPNQEAASKEWCWGLAADGHGHVASLRTGSPQVRAWPAQAHVEQCVTWMPGPRHVMD